MRAMQRAHFRVAYQRPETGLALGYSSGPVNFLRTLRTAPRSENQQKENTSLTKVD